MFSLVGRNSADGGASTAGALGRIVVMARTTVAATGKMATTAHALLLRRGTATVLIGLERRLLILWSSSIVTRILAAVSSCVGEENYGSRYPEKLLGGTARTCARLDICAT